MKIEKTIELIHQFMSAKTVENDAVSIHELKEIIKQLAKENNEEAQNCLMISLTI